MEIIVIVAISTNGIIGNKGDLPWHLPHDMKHFKDTTKSYSVVMGRKNWESIPEKYRPLPNRENYVLSRNSKYKAEGAQVMSSLDDIIVECENNDEDKLFIIGGAEIYYLALESVVIDKLIITEVLNDEIKRDTEFEILDWSIWKEFSRIIHPADNKHKYNFNIISYRNIR